MLVELVEMTTTDGMAQSGMFLPPGGSPRSSVQSVLLVHGTMGNFYTANFQLYASHLQAAGYAVASFNTRGRDGIARPRPNTGPIGTAYELLDDCRLDLGAATVWLAERGFERTALLGVSMGAVKAIYHAAYAEDLHVAAVVAVSPVRLSHTYYLTTEAAADYQRYYSQAQDLVNAGNPDGLINVAEEIVPGQGVFSARAYLEKYGGEVYNAVNYASRINQPMLVMAGSEETHPRLRDCARDIHASLPSGADAELVIVEGAGHSLPQMGADLPDTVVNWLDRVLPL